MQSVSFDRAASFYDATRGYAPGSAERIRDAIVAQTGATARTRLLELGVGTGRIALPFLEAGFSYAGVDLARPMLDVLLEKARGWPRRPMLVVGDGLRLPFADGSFDVVLAVHVLHLVADWRLTLREVRRALRPHGAHLLIAGDVGAKDREEAPIESLTPPLQAQRVWGEILKDLGLSGREGQPGVRPHDSALREALAGLGATVEDLDMAKYERLPLSAREVVRGYGERIYSSDWARPEELHSAAVARITRWLEEQCPDPDTAYTLTGRFQAVWARWEDPTRRG